jgi:tetratricopeptide (TPR) repeat protein
MIRRRFVLSVSVLAALTGCVSSESRADPDDLLAPLVAAWERQKDGRTGVSDLVGDQEVPDPDVVRQRLGALAHLYPNHVPTLMANAIAAYDARHPEEAQEYLDRVLTMCPAHPEAGILRARIASDEGNFTLARRVLEQQIHLRPDHPGLAETYASVLYATGRLDEARTALDRAAALGAPVWRVSFNHGLVEEQAGDVQGAKTFYEIALRANPDYHAARERLTALKALERVAPTDDPPRR